MTHLYQLFILFLFLSLFGCSADEEPCERFPKEYKYTLMESDLGPANLYEYDGDQFVVSSNSAVDQYDLLRDGETVVGVLGSYINTLTITSDTTIEPSAQGRDINETFLLNLVPYAPGYFLVIRDSNVGVVTLAGVSDVEVIYELG